MIQHHGTGDINIAITPRHQRRRSVHRRSLFSPTRGDIEVRTTTTAKKNIDGTAARTVEKKVERRSHVPGSGRAYRVKQDAEYGSRFGAENDRRYDRSSNERNNGHAYTTVSTTRPKASSLRDEATPRKALKKLFTNPIGFYKDVKQMRQEILAEKQVKKVRRKLDKRGHRSNHGGGCKGYEEEDQLIPGSSYSQTKPGYQ
jgi:hypothetical protein